MEETRIRDYHSFRIIGGIARDERIQDFNRIITSRIDIDELAEEKIGNRRAIENYNTQNQKINS